MSGMSVYYPVVGTESVHRTCNLVSSGIWMFLYGGSMVATFIAAWCVSVADFAAPILMVSTYLFWMTIVILMWIRGITQGVPNLMIPWMVFLFMKSSTALTVTLLFLRLEGTPVWAPLLTFSIAAIFGLQCAYTYGMYKKSHATKKHWPLTEAEQC